MFVVAAGILGAYVLGLLVAAVACASRGNTGPLHRFAGIRDSLGTGGIIVAVVVLHALVATAIAVTAWLGQGKRISHAVHARPAQDNEARRAEAIIGSFKLARGVDALRVWIIDSPAPNALAWHTRRSRNVAFTSGALRLPDDELEALCAYHVTALTTPSFALTAATADLVLAAEWTTNVLWLVAASTFALTLLGVPPYLAAITLLSLALLVGVTRPFFMLADRVLPRLLDNVDELADLETVRLTAEPKALAHLLLHILEDGYRVKTRWSVAHLWFERDVLELGDAPGSMSRRCRLMSARGLCARAEIAVELAEGDRTLRARLDRARAAA